MLLICKSLSWKSPCLLLTATRNAILSSLIEDAYSMTPGLQHWRRMGIGTFSCLLRQGACCVSSGLRVGGLLASLCLQGEVHLVESEKYHATSSPGNFRLTERSQWNGDCFLFSPEKKKIIIEKNVRPVDMKHEEKKVRRTWKMKGMGRRMAWHRSGIGGRSRALAGLAPRS